MFYILVLHFLAFTKGVAQGMAMREEALTASSCNQAGNRIDFAGPMLRDVFLVAEIKFN